MVLPEFLSKAIDPSGSLVSWNIAGTIFAIGAITMAIVQILKEFLPLRRGFQTYWIKRWLTYRAGQFQRRMDISHQSKVATGRPGRTDTRTLLARIADAMNDFFAAAAYIMTLKFMWETDDFAGEAWQKLIELAAFGRRRSLFRLPAEQLVAQFSSANQIILEYPNSYESLLKVFAEGADIDDIETFLRLSPDRHSGKKTSKDTPQIPSPDYLDARNRIAHRIQRNLDGIHIALTGDWKLLMQCLAFITSLGLAFVSVYATAQASGALQPWLLVLFVGLMAGYAATVMSDTISVINGLRRS